MASNFTRTILVPELDAEPPVGGTSIINVETHPDVADLYEGDVLQLVSWKWNISCFNVNDPSLSRFEGTPPALRLGHWRVGINSYIIDSGFLSFADQTSPYYSALVPSRDLPDLSLNEPIFDPDLSSSATLLNYQPETLLANQLFINPVDPITYRLRVILTVRNAADGFFAYF